MRGDVVSVYCSCQDKASMVVARESSDRLPRLVS